MHEDNEVLYEYNEVRVLAHCAECEEDIYDDVEEYYCDEDGNFYCSIECVCMAHGIHRLEI